MKSYDLYESIEIKNCHSQLNMTYPQASGLHLHLLSPSVQNQQQSLDLLTSAQRS